MLSQPYPRRMSLEIFLLIPQQLGAGGAWQAQPSGDSIIAQRKRYHPVCRCLLASSLSIAPEDFKRHRWVPGGYREETGAQKTECTEVGLGRAGTVFQLLTFCMDFHGKYNLEKNTLVLKKCCWPFAAAGILIGAQKDPLVSLTSSGLDWSFKKVLQGSPGKDRT